MGNCTCGNQATRWAGCGVTSYSPVAMLPEYGGQLCAAASRPGQAIIEHAFAGGAGLLGEFDDMATPSGLRALRAVLERVRTSDSVSEFWLRVRSPGGLVEGVAETHAAIKRLAKVKPVTVFAEGVCASAAYWFSSAATKLYAAPTCIVGSTGAIAVLIDDSAAFEAEGVRIIPVSTATAKEIGLPGVPVTDDQVARVRRRLDEVAHMFELAVERDGRMSVTQVREAFAEAEVYHGAEAKRRGYVDGVWTLEEALAEREQAFRRISIPTSVVEDDIEEFSDIVGEAAVDKLNELVCQAARVEDYFDAADHHRKAVRRNYPTLAAESDRWFEQRRAEDHNRWRRLQRPY